MKATDGFTEVASRTVFRGNLDELGAPEAMIFPLEYDPFKVFSRSCSCKDP